MVFELKWLLLDQLDFKHICAYLFIHFEILK